jgi:hypothetical protein
MPPRNRVIRTKIHNPALVRLLKDEITEDVVKVAEEILPQIADIYKDENGAPFIWKIKIDKQARAKRMYAVIYCESPDPKYKEAAHGDIARYLKSISTKSKIKINYTGEGIQLG